MLDLPRSAPEACPRRRGPLIQMDIDGGIQGFGHRPVIGPGYAETCLGCPMRYWSDFGAYVPDVSDAVGQLYTMDSAIRPLYLPMKRMVGLALTLKAPPEAGNLTIHGALNMAQAGDVLVVDWRGYTGAAPRWRVDDAPDRPGPGRRGGGWGLARHSRAAGDRFPDLRQVGCRVLPAEERPGEINVLVCCGGVVVHAGDVVVADEEGVVVVPRDFAQLVADSLRDYQPRMSVEEWDLERLKSSATERGSYYEALFNARNGTYADWPGGPGTDKS